MFPVVSVFQILLDVLYLCNIKMQELSRVLIGNYLQNYHTSAQRTKCRFCEKAGPEIKFGQ